MFWCSTLFHLTFFSNELAGDFPYQIANLTALTELSLAENQIVSLPNSISGEDHSLLGLETG